MAAHADHLEGSVYWPAYYDRLAERGFAPRTEKEASALMRIFRNLATYATIESEKTASASGDVLEGAAYALERTLEEAGHKTASAYEAPGLDEGAIKEAAASLLQDPDIARAAFEMRRAVELGI